MKTEIQEYLRVIQMIAMYRGDDEFASTPYGLNMRRMQCHEALFAKVLPLVKPVEGFLESDVYQRMKEVFYHLDRVFAKYNSVPLDLTDTAHILKLADDLATFLASPSALDFLGGKTESIPGVTEA